MLDSCGGKRVCRLCGEGKWIRGDQGASTNVRSPFRQPSLERCEHTCLIPFHLSSRTKKFPQLKGALSLPDHVSSQPSLEKKNKD